MPTNPDPLARIRAQIAALVAAREKATPGEWRRNEDARAGMSWNTFVAGPDGDIFSPFHNGGDEADMAEAVDGNVDFAITAANTNFPAWLTAFDALVKVVEAAKEYETAREELALISLVQGDKRSPIRAGAEQRRATTQKAVQAALAALSNPATPATGAKTC